MKIAVFGNVHRNLPPLELMVDDAGKVDQYISYIDLAKKLKSFLKKFLPVSIVQVIRSLIRRV